ncbi:MAG TPA: choice-of-anchor tandem repeat GloVer-containing protein, partial [Chthonomonadales bacterium]|nr:choice-of-anchor tandem repeat GloVer-containing protein [Chthonomonadales bacterium]
MKDTTCFLRFGHRRLCGAVFALILALAVGSVSSIAHANVETTVHDFPDPAVIHDGSNPFGALVYESTTGNFYGTTRAGGQFGKGAVFSMSPGFVVTTLHSFSGADGASPTCALILVVSPASGISTLYGTCLRGGSGPNGPINLGTVFKINT